MSNKKRIRDKSWRIQENADYRAVMNDAYTKKYIRLKIGGVVWSIEINDVNHDTITQLSQFKINQAT